MSKELPDFGHPRGKAPFAPEGWPFIVPTALLLLLAYMLCWTVASIVLLIVLLFLLNFFRDPNHQMPVGDDLFICPANGKVIRAETMEAGHQRVDIFMNVFDVHVNRAPMAGRICAMEYIPGTFVNADFDHASEENERNRFEMECDNGSKITFTQISGLIARRIVSYVRIGDQVEAGERIGMIRFGSRVNCEIPADYDLNVRVGDKVTAGLSILARKMASGDCPPPGGDQINDQINGQINDQVSDQKSDPLEDAMHEDQPLDKQADAPLDKKHDAQSVSCDDQASAQSSSQSSDQAVPDAKI